MRTSSIPFIWVPFVNLLISALQLFTISLFLAHFPGQKLRIYIYEYFLYQVLNKEGRVNFIPSTEQWRPDASFSFVFLRSKSKNFILLLANDTKTNWFKEVEASVIMIYHIRFCSLAINPESVWSLLKRLKPTKL